MTADAVPNPRDPRLAVWRDFLHAHAQIRRLLERELQEEQSMGLGEYEVLLFLAYHDDQRMRMSELADALLLSRSGATRLVDRLEADGLVERVSCETDRRGQWAQLTESGYDRLRRASPTHLRGVTEHFLDRLEPAELDAFSASLQRVMPSGPPAFSLRPPSRPTRAG